MSNDKIVEELEKYLCVPASKIVGEVKRLSDEREDLLSEQYWGDPHGDFRGSL